jgi:hypothetical protein
MRTEKEIIKEIDELNIRMKELQLELSNVNFAKRYQNSSSYEKRKDLLEKTAVIFADTLKPGDFVKVTGTRASPYRQVKEINQYQLIGATCTYNKRAGSIARINEYEIITCGANKIIAVLQNGKWITAKEILLQHS